MADFGVEETQLSDEELIARVAKGDRDSLGALYTRYVGAVRAMIARFVPEILPEDRNELAHEVFLDVAAAAPRYQEKSKFRSWLFEIAVRKSRRWRRNTWRRRNSLEKNKNYFIETARGGQKTPHKLLDNKQTLEEVLSKLSAEQRDVLWLSAVMGFTGEEIAQILRVKPRTVWTRLHRARQTAISLWPEASSTEDKKESPS